MKMELYSKSELGLGHHCLSHASNDTEELPLLGFPCFSKPVRLALSSFVACPHPVESCRHNGLPLTPNSTAIIGKAHILKSLSHPNLCSYLDCQRGKGERIIIASEYYESSSLSEISLKNLSNETGEYLVPKNSSIRSSEEKSKYAKETEFLLSVARQTLNALAYLDENLMVHVNLEPKNILLTNSEHNCDKSLRSGLEAINNATTVKVKLFDYGLGHMTNYGEFVAFPVFVNPAFTPPEIFLENPSIGEENDSLADNTGLGEQSPQDDAANFDSIVYIEPCQPPRYSSNCAVWSLGMILSCQFLRIDRPWPKLKASQTIRRVLSLLQFKGNVLERLAREHNCEDRLKSMTPELRDFIDMCLIADPKVRPTLSELWCQAFADSMYHKEISNSAFPTLNLRCKDLELPSRLIFTDVERCEETVTSKRDDETLVIAEEEAPLDVVNIHEIYYLWQLAGGDTLSELRKCGFIVNRPAVLSLPSMVLSEGHAQGQIKEHSSLYDSSIISLNLSQLISCLDSLSSDDLYPTCEQDYANNSHSKGDLSWQGSGNCYIRIYVGPFYKKPKYESLLSLTNYIL